MTTTLSARIDRLLERLPKAFAGPGGAIAILQDGEVIVRHAWGFANAERRIPFTPRSLFRMCSVTKQFTCALALDQHPDLAGLDAAVAARLPSLLDAPPEARHLAHNQSGLRDYWAMAMLHGAPAESDFGDEEARQVISAARTLQFPAGTRFSYCNQNFRILGDVVEERAGRPFADLLRERVFDRAGMETAFLAADTRALPDGTEGYEGSQATGFRPAINRIIWTGDAGLGACLDDMIAWERFIDATREDANSLYRRLSAPVTFEDGAPAIYGFGLNRNQTFGRLVTSHGGALRGWRSHRLHVPENRVSVVVMFNHLSDAHAAALDALAAVLGIDRPAKTPFPAPQWLGAYLDPDTGLSARIEDAGAGRVRLRHGHSAEVLDLNDDGTAGEGGTRLRVGLNGLRLERPQDNYAVGLVPAGEVECGEIAGRYRCAEIDAELTVVEAGGALYGAFSGRLGRGRMEALEPIGGNMWALPCPRALDHTPPGDWTLAFQPGESIASRVTVGCWLARGLVYDRVA